MITGSPPTHWVNGNAQSITASNKSRFSKAITCICLPYAIISIPFLFISVQDIHTQTIVCVLRVYVWHKMNGCTGSMYVFWIIYQSKSRGGVASPCLRHRGTPLDRMSLLVLLSRKAHLCQMLNQTWRDSCWVSIHIYRSTFYHFCICSSAVLNNLPYSAGWIDIYQETTIMFQLSWVELARVEL